MLQYPTNFYPENIAIDANGETNYWEFTFNGDILSTLYFRVYDYVTGELVEGSAWTPTTRQPLKYNGETIGLYGGISSIANGHDYIIQMLMTQCDGTGANNIYDMPTVHGKVNGTFTSATTIKIGSGISNIYEWGYDSNDGLYKPFYPHGYLANGLMIQIGNERRLIESYNKATGEIVLESSFTETIADGTPYQIYSNYLVTPPYWFMCRTTPTVTPTITWLAKGVQASLAYSQAQGSLIKYAEYSLYRREDGSSYTFVDKSDKIFSQNPIWIFGEDYTKRDVDDNRAYYKLTCKVVTQENAVVEADAISQAPSEGTPSVPIPSTINPTFVKTGGYVIIHLSSSYDCRVYRKDMNTGESELIGIHSGEPSFLDMVASNHGKYKYRIIPFAHESEDVYAAIESDVVTTDDNCYTITAIYDSGKDFEHKHYYTFGDTWRFIADISNTTINQNGDRVLNIGYGKYPTSSSTELDYLSGSLSAMIGYMNCLTKTYVDDIQLVNAWRKFITQQCSFILRSQKGDVLIVNVQDNPSTEYQEDAPTIPTRISFSWAECANWRDVVVGRTIYSHLDDRR